MNWTLECIINDHVLAEVGEKKTPSVKFKMTPVKNVVTGEEIQPFTLYFDAWLTEKSIENSLKTLSQCFGWNGSDLSDFNGTGRFVGFKVWAVCEEEEYENELRTKVRFMNPLGGGGSTKPMDDKGQKKLTDALKGRILKFRKDNPDSEIPEGAKPSNQSSQKMTDDSELPF